MIRNDFSRPKYLLLWKDKPNQPSGVKNNSFTTCCMVNLNKTQTFDIKFIIIELLKDNSPNPTAKESGKRSKDRWRTDGRTDGRLDGQTDGQTMGFNRLRATNVSLFPVTNVRSVNIGLSGLDYFLCEFWNRLNKNPLSYSIKQ